MYATGIGSLPGSDMPGALRHVLGSFEQSWLPELPARGVGADMVGRTLAMTEGLGFDLQPQGWRLTDAPGVDHARARGLLRRDLDDLEEAAQGFHGSITLTLAGPWTLSALVERPRGDKLLADHGARRDLAQSLAAGARGLLSEMRRRLPEVTWRAQLDEPLLPAVMAGDIATASGFSRWRPVDRPEASELLGILTTALHDQVQGIRLHCCAEGVDLDLLQRSGVDEVALDLQRLASRELDQLAGWLESGRGVVLGAAPTNDPDQISRPDEIVRRALRLVRVLGLDPELLQRTLALSPACGLAGWSVTAASHQLDHLQEAVPLLAEQVAR